MMWKLFGRKSRKKSKDTLIKNVINDPIVTDVSHAFQSKSDPEGMYTGIPLNENESPVQDSDDL